ncbi:calponin homology domain-containing protein [Chytridium lagenaria]|nr:calponin homology domain-containing protein [Chytridium lagenaria]
MSESRTELLAWMNDLLQLGYTKVEQCGTGAAHCQIMDSIFRDVPVSRVKFAAKHEYEYIQNFKILQLAKCKFQDNLEFLQWMKKYWDQYFPGGPYDAIARRKDASSRTASGPMKKATSNPSVANVPKGAPTRSSNGALPSAPGWEREKAEIEAEYQRNIAEYTQQNMELKMQMDQVEKEREFYFGKLREIEILVQTHLDTGEANGHLGETLRNIQAIMYKTEDGFEIPIENEEEGVEVPEYESY